MPGSELGPRCRPTPDNQTGGRPAGHHGPRDVGRGSPAGAPIVGGPDDPTASADLPLARHRVLDLNRGVVERLGEEVLVVGVDEIQTAPKRASISSTPTA